MTVKKVRFTGIIQSRDADTSYEYGDEVEQEEGEGDDDYMRACLITLGIVALVGVIMAVVFFAVREVGG